MVNLLEENQNCWICVFYHRVWRLWRINNERIGYEICHNFETEMRDSKDLLEEYFQLDIDLEQLYKEWASKCSYFRKLIEEKGEVFKGIRILKQEPLEALFAFIFSANNNISRISKMVEQFCVLYGTKIDLNNGTFYNFPTFLQLTNNLSSMEETLRKCGFGYRAKNVSKTVEKLLNEESIKNAGGAECWLKSLGELKYLEASKELQKLPGVGPKVSDCFCLMALGMHNVVPVDRHILKLTKEIYKPTFLNLNKTKTTTNLTENVSKQIGQFYIELFGDYAGWIQSILFSTRLGRFKIK
uniref:DNA-(apurinic or apyrimidinic site) lyase n=1 Tax=Meloidogyne enterolobii TaxID=390850 RepID=A0A6V7WCQ1_MELEN|nr:unnamed protein product [Meloidogyne enterolobii]